MPGGKEVISSGCFLYVKFINGLAVASIFLLPPPFRFIALRHTRSLNSVLCLETTFAARRGPKATPFWLRRTHDSVAQGTDYGSQTRRFGETKVSVSATDAHPASAPLSARLDI